MTSSNGPMKHSLRSLLEPKSGSSSVSGRIAKLLGPLPRSHGCHFAIGKEKLTPRKQGQGVDVTGTMEGLDPSLPLNFPIVCAKIFVEFFSLLTWIGLGSALSTPKSLSNAAVM